MLILIQNTKILKNHVTAHFLNQLYHSLSREFCIMQCKKIPKSAKLCKCTSLTTLHYSTSISFVEEFYHPHHTGVGTEFNNKSRVVKLIVPSNILVTFEITN